MKNLNKMGRNPCRLHPIVSSYSTLACMQSDDLCLYFVCFIPVVSDSFLQIYKIKKEKSIPCFRFEAEYIGNGGWHQYLFLHCYYLRSCSSMICTYFSGVAPTSTIGLPPTGIKKRVGSACTPKCLHKSFSLSAFTL